MKKQLGSLIIAAGVTFMSTACGGEGTPIAQTVTVTATEAVPTTVPSTIRQTVTDVSVSEATTTLPAQTRTLPAVTKTAPPKTVRVTERVTETQQVTETEQAPAPEDPAPTSGSVENGDYIIGSEIESGTYKCGDGGDLTRWEVNDQANEFIDGGIDTVATVPASGFVVKLNDCNTSWTKVA